MHAVVEDHDRLVGHVLDVMLMGGRAVTPLPLDFAGAGTDFHDGADTPETEQPVALGGERNRIRMAPLQPVIQRADHLGLRVEMLPRLPLFDDLVPGRHLDHHIAQHVRRVVVLGVVTALDPLYRRLGHGLPLVDERVAVTQALVIVMQPRIIVAPDDIAFPIHFVAGRSHTVQAALSDHLRHG